MGKRQLVNLDDRMRLMRLLADVAALKGDAPGQRTVLIDGLSRLLGTDQGFFYVADGWTPGGRAQWAHQTLSSHLDPVALRYFSDFGITFPITADPYGASTIGNPARLQAVTRADVLPDRAAERRHRHFLDMSSAAGVADGVVALHRLRADPTRIVGFGMHNFRSSGRLRPHQVAMAKLAVAEINDLVERGHLALPPINGVAQLPPRLRQIRDLLLGGMNPKRMAHKLGLSIHTVREHIQRLYKHYDVSGRDELMARFVQH